MQSLRNLLNLAPDEELSVDLIDLNELSSPEVDLNVPLSVLANRPDLRGSLARLQSAYYQQQSQQRAWYPNISLSAGVSSANEQLGKILSLPIGSASVSVNLPFLQWRTLQWQDQQAQAAFATAQLDFEKTLTTALNEVDNLYQNYQTANHQLAITRQRLQSEQASVKYYHAQYQLGKSELSDYLNALNGLDNTETAELNQRYNALKAELAIFQAMAGAYRAR